MARDYFDGFVSEDDSFRGTLSLQQVTSRSGFVRCRFGSTRYVSKRCIEGPNWGYVKSNYAHAPGRVFSHIKEKLGGWEREESGSADRNVDLRSIAQRKA